MLPMQRIWAALTSGRYGPAARLLHLRGRLTMQRLHQPCDTGFLGTFPGALFASHSFLPGNLLGVELCLL